MPDGSLQHSAEVEPEPNSGDQAFARADLIAQARYFHMPAKPVGFDAASELVTRLGLPHSTNEAVGVPPWLGDLDFRLAEEDLAAEVDDPTSGECVFEEPSVLTHMTVVHGVASLPARPSADQLAAAVAEIEELVHTTIRALHAVRGLGWQVQSLESPLMEVLVGLDEVVDGQVQAVWNLGVYTPRMAWLGLSDTLEDLDLETMRHAEVEFAQHTPRSLVLDLQRHAVAAGRRQRDPRTAVIMAAATCESWIDLMIGALLWSEGLTPEQGAAEMTRFRDAKERLIRLLAPRLKGSWDLARVPALRAWDTEVRLARNRVLHAGGLPSLGLADRSIDAMYGLLSLTLDRLCSPKIRSRYPIPALILARRVGLEARDGWTNRMRAAADEADRDDLTATFNRWYSATATLMLPERMRPRPATAGRLELVHLRDGTEYWIERDHAMRLTRLVKPKGPLVEKALAAAPRPDDQALTISFDLGIPYEALGGWVPEHNLVPGAAVMRDTSTWDWPPLRPPQGPAPSNLAVATRSARGSRVLHTAHRLIRGAAPRE